MSTTPDDIRNIRSAEGVATLYHHLGYEADLEPEGYSASEAFITGAAAQGVQKVYPVGALGDLQHFHVESTDLSSYRLRQLSDNFLKRPGTYLLSVASPSYDKVVFIKPSRAQGKTKISKLTVQPASPTAHDASILRAIAVNGTQNAAGVHEAQVRAFDVERVTRDFYRVYHDLFYKVLATVRELNPDTRIGPLIRNTTEDKPSLHAFTQRLLSRVMFLYFIQKKGWLDGKHDYLSRLYRESAAPHTNFYRDVLESLFFTLLNDPERDQSSSAFGKVPYLNGSLFEREYPLETQLELPNALFDPREDGSVLNVFDRYNFTINESSSLDQEVSLDPEMLGKVFENMMEAEEAAKNGTFYTPRSIVQFLAEESLSRYLADKTAIARERLMELLSEDDSYGDISISEANKIIVALAEVRVLDPAVGTASMLVGTLNVLVGIRRSAEARLGVKVKEGSPRFSEWKREYINHCLYGVDIKQEAIEIGRLRLWLSLVVDAQEPEPLPNLDYKLMAGDGLLESIEGTPFINVQQGVVGHLGEIRQLTHDIEALHSKFFVEQDLTERSEYRKDIQQKERELFRVDIDQRIANTKALLLEIDRREKSRKGDEKKAQNLIEHFNRLLELRRNVWDAREPLPFFLHNVHFSEVMKGKGGFDVVIGNPPYVRINNMGTTYKQALGKAFTEVHSGNADLYIYFYKKAFDLLSPNGRVAFITPNKFLTSGYGISLRSFLQEHTNIELLVDFGDLRVFDAKFSPFIVVLKKSDFLSDVTIDSLPEHTLKTYLSESIKIGRAAVRESLGSFHTFARPLLQPMQQEHLHSEGWVLNDSEVLTLSKKIAAAGIPLSQLVNGAFYRGLTTGLNDAFVIDSTTRAQLLETDPESETFIKPFLRGRDVKRWNLDPASLYIIIIRSSTDKGSEHPWKFESREESARDIFAAAYPALHQHLTKYENDLRPRHDQGKFWWELRPCTYLEEFEKPKIIYPDIATGMRASWDEEGYFCGNTLYIIPTGDKWITAVLNSNVIKFYSLLNATKIYDNFLRFIARFMQNIPVAQLIETSDTVNALVDVLLAHSRTTKTTEAKAAEATINEIVYKAYGLDETEIVYLENYVKQLNLSAYDDFVQEDNG